MLFHFNSHAHVERDIYGALFFGDYDHFNSHAHVERDNKPQPYLQILTNFNSHAHVERDPQLYLLKPSQGISTHTLTWSVTLASPLYHFTTLISTHTLTWSVT